MNEVIILLTEAAYRIYSNEFYMLKGKILLNGTIEEFTDLQMAEFEKQAIVLETKMREALNFICILKGLRRPETEEQP